MGAGGCIKHISKYPVPGREQSAMKEKESEVRALESGAGGQT